MEPGRLGAEAFQLGPLILAEPRMLILLSHQAIVGASRALVITRCR
jgi:hypothetical protein